MDFSRSGPSGSTNHQIVVWRCVEDGCRTLVPSSANHCTAASHGRFDGGGKQASQVSTTEAIPGDAEKSRWRVLFLTLQAGCVGFMESSFRGCQTWDQLHPYAAM